MRLTENVREKIVSKPTLLIGPAGAGKTHHCLREFSEQIQTSKDPLQNHLLFILPTVEHRERIIDLLSRGAVHGFFGRYITTFDESLQSFLKLGDIHFASNVTRYLILKDLIAQGEFDYFKEAAKTKGFVDLVSRWIGELKESFVTANEFQKFILKLEQKFPESRVKYQELAKLYSDYHARLEHDQLKDKQDALFMLEEGLMRGAWKMPRFKQVWIDGFFDFSKLQLAFVKFLTRHSNGVTVTLALDVHSNRSTLFQIPHETKKRLLEMGFQITDLGNWNRRAQDKMLAHLDQNLFLESEPVQIKPDSAVQIFEATGLVGELEMIAREIKKIVRNRKLNYSDIALIFRQVGPYLNVIRSVFLGFDIPVEIHEREELRLNSMARTVMNLFRIFLGDWKREDLFNFLKSKYIHADYELVSKTELLTAREGIVRGRDHWLKTFDLPELKLLADLEDRFKTSDSVEVYVRIARESFKQFRMSELPDHLSESNKLDHAALKRVYLLLDEIRYKYSNSKISFTDFSEILIRLIEIDLFSFHTRDKNKVQVYNVSLARQKEYKVVFMPGLLEKQFPVQVKEDPLLSDEERRMVNQDQEILRERLPRQSVERLFFYLGVTRASEQLILSYPRFNLEGKEALPSFYVDEVRVLFNGDIETQKQAIRDVLPRIELSSIPKEAMAHVIQNFWQVPEVKGGVRREHRVAALYNAFLGNPHFERLIRNLLTPIEGQILDERVKAAFRPKEDIYTPSRLEEYAECPYRFFADQLLHLESGEEEIDPRTVGKILHQVLENFHTWAKPRGIKNIDIAIARKICAGYLKEALHEIPLVGDRWYKVELKKHELAKIVNQLLEQELVKQKPPLPGLTPAYFEIKFGFSPENDHLILQGESGKIKFRGQIDRIDIDESGKFALVIDYKTGKSFSRKSLEKGTELQLPLYLLAAKQKLGLKPLGGHLYQLTAAYSSGFHHESHLHAAGIETRKQNQLKPEEWNELFEKITFFVSRFVKGIEEAEIPVRPRDCIRFCPYSGVCRIEKWKLDSIYEEISTEDEKNWQDQKAKVKI